MMDYPASFLLQLLVMVYCQVPPSQMQVGPAYPDGILVTTNQLLQPAGSRIAFAGSPADIAVSPDGSTVALSVGKSVSLYSVAGTLQRTLQLPGAVTYSGLTFSADGQQLAVSHASGVTVVFLSTGVTYSRTVALPDPVPCGLAFDPVRPYLYVALNTRNQVARIDLNEWKVADTLPVGVAPFGLAMAPAGDRLFVSNWGGRPPSTGQLRALSNGTPVLVDAHGLPASGTVSIIDLNGFSTIVDLNVGLHPSGIRASSDGALVAVANANSDSISFIDTVALTVVSQTDLSAYPENYTGSSPTSLAFNADSSRLYVTCGGNNSVVALSWRGGGYEVDAAAPTDWYPVAVAVSSIAGSDVVFVANAKGIGSRASQGPFSAAQRMGTMGRLEARDFGDFRHVLELNQPFGIPLRMDKVGEAIQRSPKPRAAGLQRLGVQHVFLIIKENRTYDQVLGDLGVGNGSPKLAIYGAQVTPNHHLLASQFATLDNFYATGVVSADGHQWITQAMATDYVERSYTAGWPRSYSLTGDDPMVFAPTGFLWDNAIRNDLTVRIFGEFTVAAGAYPGTWANYLLDAQSPQMHYSTPSRSPLASAQGLIDPDYPTFALNVPDQFRARIFLDKFQQYVQDGNLPNLVIIWLPSDHTGGTTPNTPSPQAMVADNDLALGRIVEAISNSPYWGSSTIFVTEDDAQDGVDHVDGHRTICLVISPFTRRGLVDSTSYNQTSVVRTIEDLLNLPQMNKFDAAALPMQSVFADAPNRTPYYAVSNQIALAQMNPELRILRGSQRKDALASMKMNFSVPDAAPEELLNRILWRSAVGSKPPYPKIPHRPDCKPLERDD